jgi:hypothetical protein
MWRGRAGRLASPLNCVPRSKHKKKADTEQKAFKDIKKTIAKNTLPIYPDFDEQFELHTAVSQSHCPALTSRPHLLTYT